MEVYGNTDQENGSKTEKDKKNSNRTRQKNKRVDIEKWDQTGSPEIGAGILFVCFIA